MATWARYLRKVDVAWNPWKTKSIASSWLSHVTASKVKDASPKLVITTKLMPNAANAAPETPLVDMTELTFVDGTKKMLDFSDGSIAKYNDILEVIDQENGRIMQEEAKRGKPFS